MTPAGPGGPLPIRRLLHGPPAPPGRILYTGVWFRGHNNPRYAELLPRLERLDRFLLTLAERSPLRGVEYRAWRATRRLTDPVILGAGGRRYRSLLTADNEQIAYWPGPVVSDIDDPWLTDRDVSLLARPQVAAYVVTAERTARRYEERGVEHPWYVIPQGVSLRDVTPGLVADIARRHRRDEVVVGYMAAFLLTRTDRGGDNDMYSVEHLLELWEAIRARVPRARLWLLGDAGPGLRTRVAGRDDIVLFGRVPRSEILAYAANFDVALYARTEDRGVQAAKIADYLGAGAPIVSYDFEVVEELRGSGAALLADSPRDFVDAVARLAEDAPLRAGLAAASRSLGEARDWDALARRYAEILDAHLP